MAIEKLSVILELVSGNYKKEAKEAAAATSGISGAAKSVTGSLRAMVGPAAIGAAIVGLGNLAMKAGENADRLFDLAAQTGLSTDALQEWEFVARSAGAETEVFSDAVKAVIKNLSDTEGATGAAAKAYDTLGISVKDASGNLRDAGAITDEVFAKLAGMTNITARNALAQDIFGKKWEETVSILDLGSEALGKLRKEGQATVISAANLRSADRFREAIEKLKASSMALVNQGLGSIAPLLTAIADEASDAVAALDGFFSVVDRGITAVTGNAEATDQAREAADKYSSILDILVPGITASLAPWGELNAILEDNAAAATTAAEAHDSWMTVVPRLVSVIGPTIEMIDSQARAFSNAAKAADTQRRALINLFTAQADLLDPVRSVLLLTKESIEADKRLVEVQGDAKASSEELALAVIEAEQAELRLNSASAALSADQIQAFSQLLVRELGYSEKAALDLLIALGLVDGFEVNVKVNFEVANKSILDAITSRGGTSGINNTQIQVRHGGGVVAGPRGSEQLILAQGGEGIIPLSQMRGSTTTMSRANNFYFGARGPDRPVDLQWISLLGNHQTFGKFS